MKQVVAVISPFVLKQKVCVYDNERCIQEIDCALSDIEHVCYALCRQNDTPILKIKGWEAIGDKVQRELNRSTEFNDFPITVEMI
jgi:hypothetical protein